MKVCVVTVYNSLNSGSYWQAKSLELVLLDMGNDVSFLRRNDLTSSSNIFSKIKAIIKRLIKFQFTDASRQIKIFKRFSKLQKSFHVITQKEAQNANVIVLGSDTIWNLDSKHFSKNYRRYFGGIFSNKNIISYAASVGNTSMEKFNSYNDIPSMLNNINKISVRDKYSYDTIKKLTTNEVKDVCDPTLLLTKEEYKKLEKDSSEKHKYIFLYLFANLSKKQENELKKFAFENDLKIISGAKYMNFVDECVVNAPDLFLNHMLYADYIVTDTFHGTLFSINLNKQFVVIDRNKNKVNDILNKFKLDNRLTRNSDDLIKNLNNRVDYDIINKAVDVYRKESLKFLEEAIKNR